MKKTILISASILCLSACSLFGNGLKNTPPTDIKVELSVGWTNKETGLIEVVDKDVYINTYKKDTYDSSYFAHFDDGNYVYYRKDVLNNGDWESYVPTTTKSKNMTTFDAINSFVGTISNVYADIFDVELANYAQPSGTDQVLKINTTKYKAKNRTYWYLEGVNIFLKIDDEVEEKLSCKVTDYQYYRHFDDSPNL